MEAGREAEIIRDFAKKNIDILIGTQILAKGFDFDGLSLVAVIQADSLLGQQDFRADERAVQLLEQFAEGAAEGATRDFSSFRLRSLTILCTMFSSLRMRLRIRKSVWWIP